VHAYFRFVLRHRVGVLLVCLAITVLSLAGASRMVIASSVAKLFLDDVPEFATYQERMADFGNDEVFVVAYRDEAPLSPASLGRLEEATEVIAGWEDVASVTSLLDVGELRVEDGEVRAATYAERARSGEAEQAQAELLADPDIVGSLISKDLQSAALLVELEVDPDRPVERGPLLVGETLAELERVGFAAEHLHRAGFPALIAEVMEQTYHNITTLFPLSALALGLVVWLLFRRTAPVLVTLGVGGLSVIWTLGFSSVLDRDFNVFTGLVPAMVLTVAFSDIVHLWSAWLLELRHGKSHEEAILASASDVGTACLLTSATTCTGFLSLALVPTPVSRQLGVVLGFGVGVALLLAMTLVPIALSWLQPPPPDSRKRVDDALDRVLGLAAHVSTRHTAWVLAAFAVLAIPLGMGFWSFEIQTDFSKRFAPDNDFRQDLAFFEESFDGTTTVDLFLDAPEPEGLAETGVFGRVAELHDALEALPEVDDVSSPVDLMRRLHEGITGESSLPTAHGAIEQYLLLLEMAGDEGAVGRALARTWDYDHSTLRLELRTKELEYRALGRLGVQAAEVAERVMGETAVVEATGQAYLLGWSFDNLLVGQRRGLLASAGVIALMMMIGLRSFRVGLLSMIPNLLPLVVLVAGAAWRWGATDSDIVIVLIMAIGIGVDDTIHFLMRYRVEAARTDSVEQAIERTFDFAGRGIVMTTVLLCAGFLPFALSDYFSVDMLGSQLPLALVVALIADLLLVPALVRIGWLRF